MGSLQSMRWSEGAPGRLGNAKRQAPRRRDGVGARGARADLLSQSANCLLVSLRASCDARPLVLLHRNNIRESYNQGLYTGHTTAPYLLFLALAGTGGPLRFFDVDASFAARCACLKRSMLALLCTL